MAGQKAQPKANTRDREWATLDDDQSSIHRSGLLDPNDPFGDPFADDNDTPMHERQRMQCESCYTNDGGCADFVKGERSSRARSGSD